MIHDAFTAKKIAELLIQINAIKLEPKNPFTWSSGGNLQSIVTTHRIVISDRSHIHPRAVCQAN